MNHPFFKDFDLKSQRIVPVSSMIKGVSFMLLSPAMVLLIMVVYSRISLEDALYGLLFIAVIAIMFIRPYIANLSALTFYVRRLATNEQISPPNLSFLNNVEELSDAVSSLHQVWEGNRKRMQMLIDEERVLIDTLPEAMIMLDSDLHIVRTNKALRNIFGGKHFAETTEKIIQDTNVKRAAKRLLNGGSAQEIHLYLDEPFYKNFIIHLGFFNKASEGEVSLVLLMHDISEQKQTEKMLSDFVANASHEIRTPLTSLMGFIETIQTAAKDDPEAQKKFVDIMAGQAMRMKSLVDGLLSLSNIEKNLYTRPQDDVSIPAILREVQSHLSVQADEKNMNINLDIQKSLPKVLGDNGEVLQVFENLIGNAIKYSNPHTQILVKADKVKNTYNGKSLPECEEVLRITVSDESEGIAKQHIDRLTERFYRVDPARSRKVGGTGLGLSIVKHILDRHKGLLHIESVVGKGSVFTVLFPLEGQEQ
jgi:two-component system phosphate regulon sensor histidine kinase PhoR